MSTLWSRARSCLHSIAAPITLEIVEQDKQSFIWFPVFLAFGIGLYFSLPTEPNLLIGAFAVLFILAIKNKISKYHTSTLLLFFIAMGFFAAQLRTHIIHTPILQKEIGITVVMGTIDVIERMEAGKGTRVTLSHLNVEDLEKKDTPTKIRLRLRKDAEFHIGQHVKLLAHLNVPSSPVIPGGFDFQRHLYFKQIGAVGFVYKVMEIDADEPSSWPNILQYTRDAIALKIEKHVHPSVSGLAAALMIGSRTAITTEDSDAMRASGLAHLLAISGLHVGLLSGVLFFSARLFMTAIPSMALKYPVKKYAALFAMTGAFIYMLLAGATIPTQRAFLMTSIVFIAILFDRSAVSLRLVAFAAFMVLLLFPESLISASFHMSFAAVTALILAYERITPIWTKWQSKGGLIRRIGLYVLGVSLTTMIASLATAPFALFHFQQMALYSLLANVLAMPLMAFFIMPLIVVSFLLAPFSLEYLSLGFLEHGLRLVLDIAHTVEDIPHGLFLQPSWPQSSLVLFVIGALILALFKTRLKWAGSLLIILGLIQIPYNQKMDILISSNFKLVGVHTETENLYVNNMRGERFARENWLRSFGLKEGRLAKWEKEAQAQELIAQETVAQKTDTKEDTAHQSQGHSHKNIACDEYACRWEQKGYKISYLHNLALSAQECAQNDIVITSEVLKDCKAPIKLHKWDTYRNGSHGIYLNQDGAIIETSASLRGQRPWSHQNKTFQPWILTF